MDAPAPTIVEVAHHLKYVAAMFAFAILSPKPLHVLVRTVEQSPTVVVVPGVVASDVLVRMSA
jgi:hypothetical protein